MFYRFVVVESATRLLSNDFATVHLYIYISVTRRENLYKEKCLSSFFAEAFEVSHQPTVFPRCTSDQRLFTPETFRHRRRTEANFEGRNELNGCLSLCSGRFFKRSDVPCLEFNEETFLKNHRQ